jgi:tetratricopeptide (TPR) repeat protein/cellulose biosynthesis protein BcsQ
MMASMNGQIRGRIITFYSYKGGTGRSMALANVACLLARGLVGYTGKPPDRDSRSLAIDWDLEAPGLHRYFAPFLPDAWIHNSDAYDCTYPGLIDLMIEIDKATQGRSYGGDEHVLTSVLDDLQIESRFVIATSIPNLSFMKAGRFDDGYPSRVSDFRWDLLYERMPSLITALARYLAERYAYVVIDSRTGITDTSGICTMLMPELLVVVFTPNLQSLSGVIDFVHEATDYRRRSADLRPLVIFPLPSRIETAKPQLLEQWRNGSVTTTFRGFQAAFEAAFVESYGLEGCNLTAYFDEVQIQHVPDYAYGEQIAVAIEETDSRLSLRRSYESFTERLIGLPTPWTDPSIAAAETRIIELCQIGAMELDRGNPKGSQRQLLDALNVYLESESFPVPELADGLHRLGLHYLDEGELGEARTMLSEALVVAERGFGSHDLRVAGKLESLGDALTAAGNAQEALVLMRRACDLRIEILGLKHPSVAELNDKLGALLASMGRMEESRVYLLESLETRRERFGPNDPRLAVSLERLADTASSMGNVREAEAYLNEALKIGASEGPATRARIVGSLGWLSLRERNFAMAERYFQEAIESQGSADEDPSTANILDGLAQVAIAYGDFENAQSYYERSQLARETMLGPSHPETLRSIVNLGDLAVAQGNWGRANRHYRRVIQLVERTIGEFHPLAAEIHSKLAMLAQTRESYQEAEGFYRRSLDISERLGDQAGMAHGYRQLATVAHEQRRQHNALFPTSASGWRWASSRSSVYIAS